MIIQLIKNKVTQIPLLTVPLDNLGPESDLVGGTVTVPMNNLQVSPERGIRSSAVLKVNVVHANLI